jgi:hypothetical protein
MSLYNSDIKEVRRLIQLQEQAEELPINIFGRVPDYGSSGSGKSSGPTDPINNKLTTLTDLLPIEEDRMSENIYWKDAIKSQHPITRKAAPSFWMCGGKVIYWHGQESDEANLILSKLEKAPSKDIELTQECAWCGGDCNPLLPFTNQRGETFCSSYHRTASNSALRAFLSNNP